jgi:hypothetical protein
MTIEHNSLILYRYSNMFRILELIIRLASEHFKKNLTVLYTTHVFIYYLP